MPRPALLLVALFLGAALISAFTILQRLDPFDEGLVLQAARRVSEGQAPYGDFTWAYGPAWPYLLAGLFKLFGTSLLQWRILWAIANAGASTIAFVLVRRHAPGWLALVAWLAIACELAEPRTANPFPWALLFALAAILAADSRRVVLAGALTGVGAAFRLDFSLYALAAIVVLFALERLPVRTVIRYVGVAVGLGVLVHLPFVIAFGPGKVWDALVATSLRERNYWTLPFPWAYDGSVGSPKGLKHLLDFYVPALLVVGLALAGIATLWRRVPPLWCALCVFGLGGLSYLLSRTDEFHTAPLFVTLALLLPLVVTWAWALPRGRVLAVLGAVVLALLLVHGAANRASALLRPPALSTVHLAVADGAEDPPAEARSLERVVALVHARVPPGDSIYVAPARSDLVRYSNSIVYVLAERDNATDKDFGLLTSAAAQARLVAQLERARPKAIVRWTDPLGSSSEPNRRGRSTGVHTLDRWIAAHYKPLAVLYHYTVLVPR